MRLNIVVPGQVTPEFVGLSKAFADRRLTFEYFPSLYEWLFYVWFLALAVLIFLIGYKLLPLTRSEASDKVVAYASEAAENAEARDGANR